MSTVRDRNESAWLLPDDGTRTNHRLRADMRRDRVSDEAGSHRLYWTEPRVIDGTDPVPRGSNNSGRGVGGSMVHYAGYTPRFHPRDFETYTRGVGADWPLAYEDLKPYYEAIEQELPVAGERWPWGEPHTYPHRPHPVGGNGEIFLRGARAAGITAKVGPVAIANGRFGNRSHCIYRGFCLQGCKVSAKASPLVTHIPDALAHGAEVRADSMVTRIEVDGRTGRATGVHYVRDGIPRFQRARMVAVAGYSIETPRLLLNSASARVRRRDPHVQGAPARGQHGTVRRDGSGQGVAGRREGPRMAADERHGVVDADCRTFAVPNLYITDGSVLPTQGSANPALTIMAVAARAADRLRRSIR